MAAGVARPTQHPAAPTTGGNRHFESFQKKPPNVTHNPQFYGIYDPEQPAQQNMAGAPSSRACLYGRVANLGTAVWVQIIALTVLTGRNRSN